MKHSDLFPNEVFISQEEAQDKFNLGQGQFLHYASLANIVRDIWTTYPAAPESSNTLRGLLELGGGKHLITLFYKAMMEDTKWNPPPAKVAWKRDRGICFEDTQWV